MDEPEKKTIPTATIYIFIFQFEPPHASVSATSELGEYVKILITP